MLGTKVGSYQITEKLAKGGMGAVYLARHEIMDRTAVVKVLHPRFSHDKTMVSRFFNEARAADNIKHPGIVEIYDVGYAGNQAYIIMEHLKGDNLADRLRKRMPMANALSVVRQIAIALRAAHALGIVHRDLKPENIFVVADDKVPGGERIKLLDFGIAKLAEPRDGVMTAQGSLFGTPAYMSPEQCSDAAKVDHRADLYAVGCILYQLLVGEPPFGKGGIELLAAHLRDTPTPASEREPSIPDEVNDVTMRLLEKQPDDRFQTCRALIAALDDLDVSTFPPAPAFSKDAALSMAPTVAPPGDDDISLDPTMMTSPTEPVEPLDPALDDSMSATLPSASMTEPLAGAQGDEARDVPEPLDTNADGDQARDVPEPLDTNADGDQARDVPEPLDTKTEGELATAASVAPVHRRRYWMIAVAAVAVAGVALALVMRSRGDSASSEPAIEPAPKAPPEQPAPPVEPDDPPAPPDWHADMEDARAAVADRRWIDAISTAGNVLKQVAEHPEASGIVATARQEIVNESTYEQFVAAVDDRPEMAMAIYRKIPEDSAYRDDATERYQPVRDAWLKDQIAKAEAHRDKARCKPINRIRKRIEKHGDDPPFKDAIEQVERAMSACKDVKPEKKTVPFDKRRADVIMKTMQGSYAACAKSVGKPKKRGTFMVHANIAPSGHAPSATVTHRNIKVVQCVRNIVRTVQFPKSTTGGTSSTRVTY